DEVECVLAGVRRYSAYSSDLPNDRSAFFIAPSFVPTRSTHITFYIAETNNYTGTVWNESFNAQSSNAPRYQIWGTVFDADGSGNMALGGVQLGPHDPRPDLNGSAQQYAV